MKKFDYKLIERDLRTRAKLISFFLSEYTPKNFKFRDRLTSLIFKGKKWCRDLSYKQIYITRSDDSKMRVCIYSPKKLSSFHTAGVLWFHGGGYAMGEPEQSIPFIKELVKLGAIVVAPAYTKSTEKPYPAAINDCYLALEWMNENYHKLKFNQNKLFVGGESAGGGLTAAISLMARDKGKIKIAYQMPLYPMIDARETGTSKNNYAPVWNTNSNKLAWKKYLGDNFDISKVSKYASPSLETDYSNLPPTLTYVGDIEPFKDETEVFVTNLKQAGVEVSFKIFKGCFHGFDIVSKKSKYGREARRFFIDGFKHAILYYETESE